MTGNPLDRPGTVFRLDLMNPKLHSASTKEGMKYTIRFEVEESAYEDFAKCNNLTGLILSCMATAGENLPEEPAFTTPEIDGKRPSVHAHWLCQEMDFWRFMDTELDFFEWIKNETTAVEGLRTELEIESRKELDTDMAKHGEYLALLAKFRKWANK